MQSRLMMTCHLRYRSHTREPKEERGKSFSPPKTLPRANLTKSRSSSPTRATVSGNGPTPGFGSCFISAKTALINCLNPGLTRRSTLSCRKVLQEKITSRLETRYAQTLRYKSMNYRHLGVKKINSNAHSSRMDASLTSNLAPTRTHTAASFAQNRIESASDVSSMSPIFLEGSNSAPGATNVKNHQAPI